jgi:CubicO group peptidase (beta-lactamase class C family)
MKKNAYRLFLFILALLMWWNYGLAADKQSDYWPTKGWRTASPESQGMDSDLLAKMLDSIWKKSIDIHSVLVIRNGYMVLDAYSYPYDSEIPHHIDACTQSISSALVGIGIDKGYIKDKSQPVLDFFPTRVAKNLDANKKTMTLENLLTMTTGLECRDPFLYLQSGMMDMVIPAEWRMSRDWVQFIIDLPMAESPGTRFQYCNGAPFLLSAILQEQTGMNALSFAEKHLFEPLGISEVGWPSNPQGITLGYGHLFMRPQDMAKIGYLYLNNGSWDGKQIISSQWISASTRKYIDTTLLPGYGYHWWIASPNVYTAAGNKGQFIMVAPEKNIVAIFTGRLSPEDFTIPIDLLSSYIISAVKSPTPLPENTIGKKALESKSTLWQNTNPSDRENSKKKS